MLPSFVSERLAEWLDVTVTQVVPVSGGMIGQAMRVETPTGPLFVKWSKNAPDRLYAEEAYGLWLMERTKTIRVPQLLAVCDRTPDLPQEPLEYTFIVIEYIPTQRPQDEARFIRTFAERLAAMHRAEPLKPGHFGLKNDNFIGLMPQRNTPWSPSWPEFFRDHRLQPQIFLAEQQGHLTAERKELLQRVLEQTAALLADIPNEVSLIHGDLWAGNYLCGFGDVPVLVDPSAYFGHREMEMAYVELFGGFPTDFMPQYNAIWPLDTRYVRRRPLHQLYHLLNHLNHFGEQYGPAVEQICHHLLNSASS